MKNIFKRNQIVTIPNLLSLVRLALIPLIVWLYCTKEKYGPAVLVIAISGITDVIDGFIARHFNMISDFGKILDPLADKLTQGAIILCLTVKYPLMIALVVLFALKEIVMFTMGLVVMKKKDEVNSAKWHGKVNTVVIYTVMMALILFPNIPTIVANIMIGVTATSMLLSLLLYVIFYIGRLKQDGRF